jgi:hypothetical protein
MRFLAAGGMGAVYVGEHQALGSPVAIKTLHRAFLPHNAKTDERRKLAETLVKRFTDEAKRAASLRHANIVRVEDLGVASDGTPYLAMEFLEGMSLKELVESSGRTSHGTSPSPAAGRPTKTPRARSRGFRREAVRTGLEGAGMARVRCAGSSHAQLHAQEAGPTALQFRIEVAEPTEHRARGLRVLGRRRSAGFFLSGAGPVAIADRDGLEDLRIDHREVDAHPRAVVGIGALPVGRATAGLAGDGGERAIAPHVADHLAGLVRELDLVDRRVRPAAAAAPAVAAVATSHGVRGSRVDKADSATVTGSFD